MIYMEMKEFNKTGNKISVIGVGTWQLSDDREGNINSIRYAIDQKVNFIDTAEIYNTEDIVGEAIKGYDRGSLFIASKVWPAHFRYDDVIKACGGSLSRIGTKYLDLYQLHWPNKAIHIEETMKAMEKLVDDGKIKNIGVSNFSLEDLKEVQGAMKKYEIASNQVEYNIVTRDIEASGLFDYCRENHIAIIAYSPLSHGKIFGNKSLLNDLQRIGSRYNASPAQVALAWLLERDNTFPIPKASNAEHMKEDLKAIDIKLSKEDLDSLSKLDSKYHMESIAKQHVERSDKINSYDFKKEKTEQ